MSRNTIDFGIDLGTTNSSIAMLRGTDTEIIKNNENFEITPYMITRRLFDLRRVASDGGFIPNRSGVEVDAIAPRFSVNGLKISASPPTASQARSQFQNFVDPVVPQTPSPKCSNGKDTQSPAPSRNSIGLRSTCSEPAKKLGQSRSLAS